MKGMRMLSVAAVCLVLAGLAGLPASPTFAVEPAPDATVVYLVRHAEKEAGAGDDPPLTEEGLSRAARLRHMLSAEPIAAVYVTDARRSGQTGAPCAARAGVRPTLYPGHDAVGLSHRIRREHVGERILVVAHSNTVGPILRALGGPARRDLADDEYDRLFALVLEPGGATRTLQLRF